MAGIIEELQRGALDPNMPVDALLRRVQLAAVKLKLTNVEEWVKNELDGYRTNLPDYRKVSGQLRAWNPYHGWVPVLIQHDELADTISTAPIYQAIGTLVDLVRQKERPDSDGTIHYPLTPAQVNSLNEIMEHDSARYIVQLTRGHIVGILDRVRNMILDWAIRMEQEGIVGEGISFSEAEKAQAKQAVTNIHIGSIANMAGHIGDGNKGDVQAVQTANDAAVFHSLADAVRTGVSAGEDRQRLLAAIEAMQRTQRDRGAFGTAYAAFISAAADYMSLVSPFLPALTQILAP